MRRRASYSSDMFFLPFKADFPLARFPWLTTLVCIVCLGVFLNQQSNWQKYETAIYAYCNAPKSRITRIVFGRISGLEGEDACIDVVFGIANSPDEEQEIENMASRMRPLSGFSPEDSQIYVKDMLAEELRYYKRRVPDNPNDGLAYYTDSWNPLTMVTSAFAHADWSHILFNLIFFIAFAGAMEVLIGTGWFIAAFVAICLFTGAFSSVSAIASAQHFPTLGLSGVVMGMIGLFAYLLPSGNIRCAYWFVVFVGTIAVPAWILALWFIGGDLYKLFAHDDHGMINVMAHVTGGIAGYAFGVIFLRKIRWETRILQSEFARDKLRAEIR